MYTYIYPHACICSYHPLLNVPTPNGFGGNQVCPVTTFHEALAKFDIIIDDEGNDMYNELLVILLFYIAFSFFCLLTVVFTDNPAADSSLNPTWDDKPLAEEATSDSTIDIDIACADDQERKAMDGAYLSFTNLSYSVEVPADPSEGGRNAGTKELMLLNGIVGYAKPGLIYSRPSPVVESN